MTATNTRPTSLPANFPAHLAEGSPAWKANDHTTAGLRTAGDLRARFRTTNPGPAVPDGSWQLPVHGAFNPGADDKATTPGSFANKADIGGPRMFSSPDTPGMPAPSDKTAWDFLPEGWAVEETKRRRDEETKSSHGSDSSTPSLRLSVSSSLRRSC